MGVFAEHAMTFSFTLGSCPVEVSNHRTCPSIIDDSIFMTAHGIWWCFSARQVFFLLLFNLQNFSRLFGVWVIHCELEWEDMHSKGCISSHQTVWFNSGNKHEWDLDLCCPPHRRGQWGIAQSCVLCLLQAGPNQAFLLPQSWIIRDDKSSKQGAFHINALQEDQYEHFLIWHPE